MGEMSPAWVPGEIESGYREVRKGVSAGATGLYGGLPPGFGPLLELSAGLVVRAFTAYAAGDWETCDALVAEGREACGEIFTALAEVSPCVGSR